MENQAEVVGGNTNLLPTSTGKSKTPAANRSWCFTYFENETNKPNLINEMDYLCCGFEVCPKTGNTHWQCWTYFKTKISFSRAKEYIKESCNGIDVHIEPCRGSAEDNDKYCKKDGNFFFSVATALKGRELTCQASNNEYMKGYPLMNCYWSRL